MTFSAALENLNQESKEKEEPAKKKGHRDSIAYVPLKSHSGL